MESGGVSGTAWLVGVDSVSLHGTALIDIFLSERAWKFLLRGQRCRNLRIVSARGRVSPELSMTVQDGLWEVFEEVRN